ncbi:MAG: diguanylate cyclase [Cyanobacteria bacterium]|nr:diguanylate cyclase [Cyanobacteria bacterium CG_2015-16_32_12]NCO77746.1 diguanylate cyclase [Cyanobacteria bacterium CG_2015-22_32_23]NCQ03432.1 diguanylate cyclase [Cyanobacteria bacterium CG_2015-09_32_10]NCQ42117.1 diguanylate cyclase [Cyanobacteria bacterium CG_2015-04_32_10]NCS83576.1 diguanylate cyclase [Cyanobacteria bacterium CG_2015-02_32_10]
MNVTETLFLSVNYEVFCPQILTIIREYLHCEQVFISKLNQKEEQEFIIDFQGNNYHNLSKNSQESYQLDPRIIPYLQRESVDYYTHKDQFSLEDDTNPIKRAELAIPIIIKTPEIRKISNQKLWGILFIYDYNYLREWLLEEIKFIEDIINQLVIALERSILYEKLQFSQAELVNSQVIDEVTGLAKYSSFMDCLDYEWRRLTREKQPLSLILIEINYSGNLINNLLMAIGNIIQKEMKRPTDLGAHYKANQLIIMLPNTDNVGALWVNENIINKISSQLKKSYNYESKSSIITTIPMVNINFNSILKIVEKPLINNQNLTEKIYNQNLV